MIKTSILFIVFAFSQLPQNPAFAADKAGNGGNAVVCRNGGNSITSIELLDFYEARVLRQIKLKLETGSLNFKEIVTKKLGELARLAPKRAALYSTYIESSLSNTDLPRF